jgi:acetate kinase
MADSSQIILAINAGSSSLKITLFEEKDKKLTSLANCEISSINQPPAKRKYVCGPTKTTTEVDVSSHEDAFSHCLQSFLDEKSLTQVRGPSSITYACHRVVHGGDFASDQLITTDTFHKIEKLEDLAPLHNASAVTIIRSAFKQLPDAKQVACFDSVFHHTLPLAVSSYAIDQKIAKAKGLRKYGFHGISYAYILRAVSAHLQKPPAETSVLALHLGSGASMCAIKNGQSIDTTMGLTPVSGLPGGSRSGDIDPSLIFHYTSEASKLSPSSTKELHISQAEDILNKQSGWKALTGTSNFAEIAAEDAPETHKLAMDIFVDRIVGYVGNYFVKMGGELDAVVFAGGIGEKSAMLRRVVVERCKCLGFEIDGGKNEKPGEGAVVDIGRGGKIRTLICETDEEVCVSPLDWLSLLTLHSLKWPTVWLNIRSDASQNHRPLRSQALHVLKSGKITFSQYPCLNLASSQSRGKFPKSNLKQVETASSYQIIIGSVTLSIQRIARFILSK